MSIGKNQLIFYCPSCETAWDNVTKKVDDVKPLGFFAQNGITVATREDIESRGILEYDVNDTYDSIDDILS